LKFTENGEVTIITSIEENILKVKVKDTGIGISEEN
jgi:signal transduction histidine kinase